ncbi:MAG: endonuclease [Salinivirgaceae bacterium]
MSKKILLFVQFVVLSTTILFSQIPTGYYDGAEGLTGTDLELFLREVVTDGYNGISYGDSRYILDETDQDPNNENNVILVYLGTSVSGTWDAGATWNREHVWPQSLLGVDVSNASINEGSDLHNLKPANPSENSSRSNDYFDNYRTSDTYEPRDEVKGDVARILFYMTVRYSNLELVNNAPSTYQMALLDVLLDWHQEDPVDDFERNRNEVIYSYQNNRNPFIDHPEFVSSIWNPTAVNLSLAENIRVFPNPATSTLYVDGLKDATYSIINILGRQVQQGKLGSEAVDISVLPQGKYIILIEDKASVIAKSFVKLP